MIRGPVEIGAGAIVLLPGVIIAIIASGNVHVFSTWVLALGNFVYCVGWCI